MKSCNMETVNDKCTNIQIASAMQNVNIHSIFFRIQTNFSLLCGSQIWPNLACCVAETVDGRNSETKVVVDRYKVMTDKLKESNAKRTAGKLTDFKSILLI